MSRKKAEESNTPPIGIFLDKKSSKYNLLILETLFSQEATAWKLAEALYKKINPKDDKEVKEVKRYRIQKIYGVIQRKGGRLNDLEAKGYIKQKNGVWVLKHKAYIALYAKKPDFIIERLDKSPQVFLDDIRELMEGANAAVANKPIIKRSEWDPEAKRDFEKFIGHLTHNSIKTYFEEAKCLISEGIDLDRISEKNLQLLLIQRESL